MEITYGDDERADGNLTNINKKSNIEALVRQFAASISGTYNIVPNDYFLPTGCELHALEGDIKYILN